ncbi:MAG: selenium-binding family protein [Planctomycetia bacterium]|nr:selenium-binding family protein [Planctomycetia bacterium]
MQRREFLSTSAALSAAALATPQWLGAHEHHQHGGSASAGPGYATPLEAMKSPPEKLLYTTALYVGTGVKQPDYLATVDVDPSSPTYSQVVHRLEMPTLGDELHHFGWNACSSCHGHVDMERRFLIVPGLSSSRIHIVSCKKDAPPKLHKVIERDEIVRQTGLTAPHTVHCLADGNIMISMLGDAEGDGPGGFLLLDQDFNIAGRWEQDAAAMKYNYDFWYQPRHNVMVSSEWAAPKTFSAGFKLDDVAAGKFGQQIHFWDWEARKITNTVDLGEAGRIPLEVRFQHNPTGKHGYVGAALSSTMWHLHQEGDAWGAKQVIAVEPVEAEGWPFPVPGLITDLLLSMDDKYLYFSNWLHGDIRQYDITNPAEPKLVGQVWIGGVLGKAPKIAGQQLVGGPQMLQLSLDGKRLYVTSSLFSSWDNQFFPKMAETGSFMLQIDCDTEKGGLKVNEKFFVDFGKEPHGPARAHEMRYPGGDCTSDIWV